MEPPSCPLVTVTSSAPPPSPENELYLADLAELHAAFLSDLADASHTLDQNGGQVAKVAAIHGRLTQQFLDAQRSIIRSRAVTDAEVAEICNIADQNARALIGVAADRAARVAAGAPSAFGPPVGQVPMAQPTFRHRAFPAPRGEALPVALPAPDCSARQEIVQLGTEAVRGGQELDSLARLIDDVFESAEPQREVATRQLRVLLDSWWAAERQEDRAAIDDANARAAMRMHLAQVKANEVSTGASAPLPPPIAGTGTVTAGDTGSEPLEHAVAVRPALSPMARAFADVDHASLDSVLASLLDDLAQPADEVVAAEHPASEPAPDATIDTDDQPQEVFERFWQSLSVRRQESRGDWMFTQMMLPAIGVVAVLALILAVVG